MHPFPICIQGKFNDMAEMPTMCYMQRTGSKTLHTTGISLREKKSRAWISSLWLACFSPICLLHIDRTLYTSTDQHSELSHGDTPCWLAKHLILAASSMQCLGNYLNIFYYILPLLVYKRERKMEPWRCYGKGCRSHKRNEISGKLEIWRRPVAAVILLWLT